MEPKPDHAPLIVILGPTGSGKTALSLELAHRFNGEIIAADSRTVYVGMDIGTAKPTHAEMAHVPHHLIDVTTPDKPFNAYMFQQAASAAIRDISRRNRLPLVVGGTGLYIDALLYEFSFAGGMAEEATRSELSSRSVKELQAEISRCGLEMPADLLNPRRLIRVIERNGAPAGRGPLRPNTVVLGLDIDREELRRKVERRVDGMVDNGLVAEVRCLAEAYGWEVPAMQAPAYKSFRKYIGGDATLDEAKQLFVQMDMQYAKRQKTWFKRDPTIHWISNMEEAVDIVTTFLNK